MSVERLYIYRRGATNACALTDEKGDSHLPAPVAPDRWQFWMQTSRHPTEDGLHGFAIGDRGDADRRQGLLPFHRLGQAARNSRCPASRNTASVDHWHRHRRLLHCPIKPRSKCTANDIRDTHGISACVDATTSHQSGRWSTPPPKPSPSARGDSRRSGPE
jgi:hypothetical protein